MLLTLKVLELPSSSQIKPARSVAYVGTLSS